VGTFQGRSSAFRTSNPTLRADTFNRYSYLTGTDSRSLMTVSGTMNKALALFAILLFSGIGGAYLALSNPGIAMPLTIGGALIGFVLAMVISFKQDLAPVLSPVYAVVEGLAVGAISLIFESVYKGIVFNAAVLTVSILGMMLLLYRVGVLRATPLFVKAVSFGVLGICITYVVDIVLSLFGTQIPMIHQSSPIGIVFSLIVCGIASMTFILDFDCIEKGAQNGAPKYMEWYAGFSLLVSLVWLYLEILQLLSKLRSSNQ
jgi:uncharacterized YccA/Bax inhibitor family protein